MSQSRFYSYRRRLPHWRLTGAAYFVTWRLQKHQADLLPPERSLVASALRHFDRKRYQLDAFVVMNDHVHVLVLPLAPWRLHELVQAWKSYTTNRLQRLHGRVGTVWQDEYFDRVVRDAVELEQKAKYIRENPLKRWPELQEYPWVWVADMGE